MKILAIETSCDETAAAVIEVSGYSLPVTRIKNKNIPVTSNDIRATILSNVVASQIDIHRKFGGIFPEIASRAHTEKIIPVVEDALVSGYSLLVTRKNTIPVTSNSILDTIDVIAVTTGPGLIGSLLIGVNFAKTLAFSKNLPIIPINHLLGHIYSNWATKPLPKFPALILIVSGGHTGLVLMKSHYEIIPLGQTLDDAAGEAFDKVAKLLDLGYPGGPVISKASENGNQKRYDLPRSMLERKDYNFSFSGLKTAVLHITQKKNSINKKDLAASFQQAVIDILIGKTIQAAYEFKPESICLCGGVSANKELRAQLKKAVSKLPFSTSYHVPPMELSTDNAAMIGIAAAYHLDQKTTWDKISANSNLSI